MWADPLAAGARLQRLQQQQQLTAGLAPEQWVGLVRTAWSVSPRLGVALQVTKG